jgi:hypothetical protein
MAKIALLIGISKYSQGLTPLPAAVKDVEALARVLAHPDMGSFDTVKTLINRDVQTIRQGIEALFTPCQKEDLALLFFSGHGIKDEYGCLYLAGPETIKNKRGNLYRSTAVESAFVQDTMTRSRSRHKVIILDCCFSGAFGTGFLAKDNGDLDIEHQLGGEGIAVLTSSTSTQYSFEQSGDETSIYTRYLVEGIETGAADLDRDGRISTNELHEYAERKVREAAPAMQPKFYGFEEGFRIYLSQAPTQDPKLQYRREVERAARHSAVAGEMSEIAHRTLSLLKAQLHIRASEAAQIEDEVLEPYRKKQRSLRHYDQALAVALAKQYPLSPQLEFDLKRLQNILGLQDDDVAPIRSRLLAERESAEFMTSRINNKVLSQETVPSSPVNAGPMITDASSAAITGILSKPDLSSCHSDQPLKEEMKASRSSPRTAHTFTYAAAISSLIILGVAGTAAYHFLSRGAVEGSNVGFNASALSGPTIADAADAIHQTLLNQAGVNILDYAWELYTVKGDLKTALRELAKVNPKSASYQGAQERIEQWPAAWERNQINYEIAQRAVENWDLNKAERHANALDSTMDYWSNKQKELQAQISSARARIPTPPPEPQPDPELSPLPEKPQETRPEPENGRDRNGMTAEECEEIKRKYLAWDNEAIGAIDGEGSQIRTLCDNIDVNIPSLF